MDKLEYYDEINNFLQNNTYIEEDGTIRTNPDESNILMKFCNTMNQYVISNGSIKQELYSFNIPHLNLENVRMMDFMNDGNDNFYVILTQ